MKKYFDLGFTLKSVLPCGFRLRFLFLSSAIVKLCGGLESQLLPTYALDKAGPTSEMQFFLQRTDHQEISDLVRQYPCLALLGLMRYSYMIEISMCRNQPKLDVVFIDRQWIARKLSALFSRSIQCSLAVASFQPLRTTRSSSRATWLPLWCCDGRHRQNNNDDCGQ